MTWRGVAWAVALETKLMIKGTGSWARIRRVMALALVAALYLSTSGLGVLAQQTASFSGGIIDPDGKPAEGCKVVFKDVASGKTFTSPPSNAAGEYSLPVPVGARYQLDHVIAPDGREVPLQQIPPISVRVAGANRLDVRLVQGAVPPPVPPPPAAKAAPTTPTTTTAAKTPAPTTEKKPWYKRAGPIIGIVLGAGALAAVAAGGGGSSSSSTPVSPDTLPH